jgi:hypothetical protein
LHDFPWFIAIRPIIEFVAKSVSLPIGHGIRPLGWLFGPDDCPSLMILSQTSEAALRWDRVSCAWHVLNIALVSVPLAFSIPSQIGIVLMTPQFNPTFSQPTF